jgi:hypothetical protein
MAASALRQANIQRAVNAIAEAILARDIHISEVVAVLTAANGNTATPRESVAAVRQTRREQMVADLERMELEGRGRAAVMLVARRFARDPLDPIEVDSLARNLRRWRREKSGQCPIPAPQKI